MYNLRKITENDPKLLFEWANDPDVRVNAKSSKFITWDEHVAWFNNVLSDNSVFTYILTDAQNNIGMIRFNNNSDSLVITYSIDKKYRRQGFGALIIKKGMEVLNKSIDKPVFIAYVKKDNIASAKIFNKLGFTLKEIKIIADVEFKIFQK